jgi:hypothetical protein
VTWKITVFKSFSLFPFVLIIIHPVLPKMLLIEAKLIFLAADIGLVGEWGEAYE